MPVGSRKSTWREQQEVISTIYMLGVVSLSAEVRVGLLSGCLSSCCLTQIPVISSVIVCGGVLVGMAEVQTFYPRDLKRSWQ